MSTPDSTPSDYAGLSKQEVAERLKNPTPDATATPRTDANTGKAIAGHYGPSDSTDLYACPGGPFVHADFARTLERELTAAKAEIAYVREESATHEHFKGKAYKIADTWKSRAERAEAELRERTQWQCKCGGTDCAGMAENERLRAEVTKLKAHEGDLVIGAAILEGARKQEAREVDQLRARVADLENDLEKSRHDADDWHRAWETVTEQAKKEVAEWEQALSDCATKAAAEYGEQLKPLFAKVRELEQDKARLIDSIDVEALDAIANELTSFADSARAHSLMSVAARQRAAIDAARDGKGAT